MFSNDISRSEMAMLTVASVILTIPFIFYAKDMASSLRVIADKTAPGGNGKVPSC